MKQRKSTPQNDRNTHKDPQGNGREQSRPALPDNPPALYRLGECCTAFDSYHWCREYVYVDTPAPVKPGNAVAIALEDSNKVVVGHLITPAPVKPGDAVAITLEDSDEVAVGHFIGKATQKSTVFCFHKNGCPWPRACEC